MVPHRRAELFHGAPFQHVAEVTVTPGGFLDAPRGTLGFRREDDEEHPAETAGDAVPRDRQQPGVELHFVGAVGFLFGIRDRRPLSVPLRVGAAGST